MTEVEFQEKRGKSGLVTTNPATLTIITDKAHELYDSRAELPVSDELVADIMLNSVLEPVLIQEDGTVVDGRRRVKAAVEANKRLKAKGCETWDIPCVIKRGDGGALLGVSVSANEHRQDTTVLEKANLAVRLLNCGKSKEEAAVHFGVTTKSISDWIRLVEACSPKVKSAVDKGKLSATAAVKLAGMLPEEQDAALETLLLSGKASASNAKTLKTGGRAKMQRPKISVLRRAHASDESGIPPKYRTFLGYILGEVPETEAKVEFPWLADALKLAAKKVKKASASGDGAAK